MEAKLTSEQLTDLVQTLVGTSDTLDSAIIELFGEEYSEDSLTHEDREFIDSEIFLCATCGWWYEVADKSEIENETVCNDCNY